MIIDFHVHLFAHGHLPSRWFESMAQYLASRKPLDPEVSIQSFARRLEQRVMDPEATYLLQDMDDAGIDIVVSHPLDYGLALGDALKRIDEIVEHNRELSLKLQGRYASFTGVDPRRPNAVEFVRRTLEDGTLKGLNLYPQAGFDPASEECLAVCRVAMEMDVPVMFHSGGANFPMRARYGNPALLGDVQAELPDLKFVIGHAGFPYHWADAIDVARRNPNAYLELSQWYKLAGRDYPKFVETLREIKLEMGTERVLWASDHLSGPAVSGAKSGLKKWVECIRDLPSASADFTEEDVENMLWRNAARLLAMEVHAS